MTTSKIGRDIIMRIGSSDHAPDFEDSHIHPQNYSSALKCDSYVPTLRSLLGVLRTLRQTESLQKLVYIIFHAQSLLLRLYYVTAEVEA